MNIISKTLESIFRRLRSKYLSLFGPIVRKICPPRVPSLNHKNPVLVHLGCGELNDKRFVNIDARPFPHVHYVTKDLSLKEFSPSSVDLIYCCHVLEHISHGAVSSLLADWCGRLKSGGVLRISVPDFDSIIAIYNAKGKKIRPILPALMGGQDYPTNYHYNAFNKNFLTELFGEAGFSSVRVWDPKNAEFHGFDDWAGRELKFEDGSSFPISLNLEGVK